MTPADVDEVLVALDAPIEFHRQPEPVPAALRPDRRVCLLVLLLARTWGTKTSWKALQLLNWLVRDEQNVALLEALRSGRDLPDRPLIRLEPALDRAIDVATGIGLLEQPSTRVFQLSASGRALAARLADADVFMHEKQLLSRLGGKVTQKEVEQVLEWRQL